MEKLILCDASDLSSQVPGAPLTYMLMMGRSEWICWVWNFSKSNFFGSMKDPWDFFGSMKDTGIFLGLWKIPGFFWVYERHRDFFGSQRKTEGFFWVAKKGLRDFFGYAKNVVNFLGRQILKLWFFGYKIWISVRPPPSPPSLICVFVSGAPGSQVIHSLFWMM